MTARQTAKNRLSVLIQQYLCNKRKKKQVFAWLFYYEVIKFLHMTYFKVKSQMTWFEWGSKMNKGIRRYDRNRQQWFVQVKMLTLQ